jgi:hypothetical protein
VALKFLSSAATKKTHEGESEEMEIVDRMIERPGQEDSPWLRHFGRFLERFDHRTQDDVGTLALSWNPWLGISVCSKKSLLLEAFHFARARVSSGNFSSVWMVCIER